MSHFVGLVLLEKERISNVNNYLHEILERWSENLRVEEYEEECGYCGVRVDRGVVEKEMEKYFGHKQGELTDKIRGLFWFIRSNAFRPDWEALYGPFKGYFERLEEKRSELEKKHSRNVTKDCEECEGSGKQKTTWNKDGKWDWWVIGGRWHGWIGRENEERSDEDLIREAYNLINWPDNEEPGILNEEKNKRLKELLETLGMEELEVVKKHKKRREEREAFSKRPHEVNPSENYLPVNDFLGLMETGKGAPFCIITPEGEWIEKGSMGWWACVSDEKGDDAWRREVMTVLTKYREMTAVAVDFHV